MEKEGSTKVDTICRLETGSPEIKVQAGCFGLWGSGGQKGVFSAWKYSNVYYVAVKGRLIYPIIYRTEQKYRG